MIDFLLFLKFCLFLVGSIHLAFLLSIADSGIEKLDRLRLILLGLSGYSYFYLLFYESNDDFIARLITTSCVIFIDAAVKYFASDKTANNNTHKLYYIFSRLLLAISLITNIYPNPEIIGHIFYSETNIITYIFTSYAVLGFLLILLDGFKNKDENKKQLIFSFCFFAIIAILSDAVLPLFIYATGPILLIAPLSSAFFALTFFYQLHKAAELEMSQSITRFAYIFLCLMALGLVLLLPTSITTLKYLTFALFVFCSLIVFRIIKKEQRKHQNLQSDYRLTMSYLADIAHRLKTPLAVIDQQAEQAIQKRANTKKTLEEIRNIAHNTAVTMKNIVQINKIEYGFAHLDLATQDLALFFDQLKPELEALTAKHKFSLTYPNQVWLKFDRDRLREALLNIIDNAVKFGPKGSAINVTAVVKEDWIEISIQDEGPGIDPEIKKHLFERYYQSAEGRQHAGSSGLGLAITKWVVEEHGGRIRAKSVPGKGSTFQIKLPIISGELKTTRGVIKTIIER